MLGGNARCLTPGGEVEGTLHGSRASGRLCGSFWHGAGIPTPRGVCDLAVSRCWRKGGGDSRWPSSGRLIPAVVAWPWYPRRATAANVRWQTNLRGQVDRTCEQRYAGLDVTALHSVKDGRSRRSLVPSQTSSRRHMSLDIRLPSQRSFSVHRDLQICPAPGLSTVADWNFWRSTDLVGNRNSGIPRMVLDLIAPSCDPA